MPSHIPLKLCYSSTLFLAVFFLFMIIIRESGYFVWKILYGCFFVLSKASKGYFSWDFWRMKKQNPKEFSRTKQKKDDSIFEILIPKHKLLCFVRYRSSSKSFIISSILKIDLEA